MKVLVTGGTGFIGSGVVRLLLDAGHTVRLLTRRHELPADFRGMSVDLAHGDLKDFSSVRRAMEGMDLFYHVGEIRNINEAASQNNVKLMEEIISGMKEEGIKRIVFVSSITVAGIPKTVPAKEDTEADVVLEDHYTAYKRACENLLLNSLPDRHAIVRPAPVYGPGSRYFKGFLNAVEKFGPVGVPFIGTARNVAPLIYVKDLVSAICMAGLTPAASGHIFNLTDGLSHSWFDFLSAIMERFGKRLRIIPVPPLLLKISAAPLDVLSGAFRIKLDPVHYINYFSRDVWFDNSKAQDLLNWRPEYSLDEGVAEMLKFYRGG